MNNSFKSSMNKRLDHHNSTVMQRKYKPLSIGWYQAGCTDLWHYVNISFSHSVYNYWKLSLNHIRTKRIQSTQYYVIWSVWQLILPVWRQLSLNLYKSRSCLFLLDPPGLLLGSREVPPLKFWRMTRKFVALVERISYTTHIWFLDGHFTPYSTLTIPEIFQKSFSF